MIYTIFGGYRDPAVWVEIEDENGELDGAVHLLVLEDEDVGGGISGVLGRREARRRRDVTHHIQVLRTTDELLRHWKCKYIACVGHIRLFNSHNCTVVLLTD